MTTSAKGIQFLIQEEGKVSHAYPDPATHSDPWTIGVGHTGPEVHQGLYWSDDEIEAALRHDLAASEAMINRVVAVPITQDQFDALVSFSHNEGVGALPHSTLLRKLNAGDYEGAADEFLNWHIAGGIPHFLDARRKRERALFLGHTSPVQAPPPTSTYDLAKVQRFLGIGADGQMGPVTRMATAHWQEDHHLVSDGVIGPKTLAAMKAAGLLT